MAHDDPGLRSGADWTFSANVLWELNADWAMAGATRGSNGPRIWLGTFVSGEAQAISLHEARRFNINWVPQVTRSIVPHLVTKDSPSLCPEHSTIRILV